ncbi:MAG: hypothetical protein RR239_06580 [Oscillospiraceae bacterium]
MLVVIDFTEMEYLQILQCAKEQGLSVTEYCKKLVLNKLSTMNFPF